VVRRIEGIYIPKRGGGQIGDDICEDDSYLRRDEPPNEAELLAVFRKSTQNTPEGTFQAVLDEWIAGRVEMGLSVNPGPVDPNERPKKKPAKAFQSALERVFDEVRAEQAKKDKKRGKRK